MWSVFTLLAVSLHLRAEQFVLTPKYLFDGYEMHQNWRVVVNDNKIISAGNVKKVSIPKDATRIDLPEHTLMPGMIEGHSHIFLHPYDEADWNQQVLNEARSLRVARATVNLRRTLLAGFTFMRDLGSEGAAYADAGIKQAVDQGIIVGPGLQVAGRAIVATGSYGPKGFDPNFDVPLGAQEADGDNIIHVVRDQIKHGADVIKVYVDASWGPEHSLQPTFTQQELNMLVETAHTSGRIVAAHAHSTEGMRRAIVAGVDTIEHGLHGGNEKLYKMMVKQQIALCPTLAATESINAYRGWKKGQDPIPEEIQHQHSSFKLALNTGVIICNGSDVGVFTHGDNAIEPQLLVEYGMNEKSVLHALTMGNAKAFKIDNKVGQIKATMLADLVAVKGNPLNDIKQLSKVDFVMKNGVVYKLRGQPQHLL
ncbi:amidohydrolase family protein [Neptunicella marina]|uniref:Amidohydrolase family protein n=2 Tax=Neptunicella marina TaxID=2125989 RepID=A0A8J6J104_9ALTE|nr:amidohydrolase family protein [Neptunicella marina]